VYQPNSSSGAAALRIRKTRRHLYCMGITQHRHGTDNVWAIANLG
jgi:anaerobic selenocysteine-containing dehydrogenase